MGKREQRNHHHQMLWHHSKIKDLVGKSLFFFFKVEFTMECLVGTKERQVAVDCHTAGSACPMNRKHWPLGEEEHVVLGDDALVISCRTVVAAAQGHPSDLRAGGS